ncbi:MAG: hypothetical protein AVDCRST_MAG39-1745, partial [uncultured Sphingomonadaceae bacterium]
DPLTPVRAEPFETFAFRARSGKRAFRRPRRERCCRALGVGLRPSRSGNLAPRIRAL